MNKIWNNWANTKKGNALLRWMMFYSTWWNRAHRSASVAVFLRYSNAHNEEMGMCLTWLYFIDIYSLLYSFQSIFPYWICPGNLNKFNSNWSGSLTHCCTLYILPDAIWTTWSILHSFLIFLKSSPKDILSLLLEREEGREKKTFM